MLSAPKVSMLRLQPTPTCNLNCSYCYIPEGIRRQTGTMSSEVLETTLRRLFDEDLLEDRLVISWHGAEPLAAGLDWYEDACARIAKIVDDRTDVSHVFQTNGVLITDDWCKFLQQNDAQIGISMDGAEEQSTARVNWAGRPAHRSALRGIERLNRHGIRWSLLSVVTHETMRDPQAFIRFVRSTGCATLGFKVEETNVAHQSKLGGYAGVERLYADFVRALWEAFPPAGPVRVREFDEYREARRPDRKVQVVPVTLIPFRNLTVAVNGDFTIFAGELLFREDDRFVFGNVLDGPLLDCLQTIRFRSLTAEMLAGAKRCANSCAHYSDCGSFYISQKHAETGSFDAGETLACRLEIKTLFRSLDQASAARILPPFVSPTMPIPD
jgi:uncharacterized protein